MSAATAIREEDIRPAALMADKRACVAADRRFLLDHRDEWVEVGCPACGGGSSRPFGTKDGFTYAECVACGTVYTNPRPGAELLARFYAGSQNYAYWNAHVFPATEEARRSRIFAPRAERLMARIDALGLRPRSVLEVGAAFGTFCEELRNLGRFERIIALEPTPGLAETCRGRGFETIETMVEQLEPRPLADIVAAFEVVEHLFCPADFIARCHGLLSGSFDHEHLNYFHPESLAMLLRSTGFEVLDVQTPGRLDAELVRKHAIEGRLDLDDRPMLKRVLLDEWDALGEDFQRMLVEHRLSSHLWIIAQRA